MGKRPDSNRPALLVFACAAVVVTSMLPAQRAEAKRNGSFSGSASITEHTRVHVKVHRGDVVIHKGTGSVVQVTAQVRDCSDEGGLTGRYTPSEIIVYLERKAPIVQEGKELRIGAMLHEDFHLGVEIDYDITVPTWADLEIEAEHGQLAVHDVGHRIHVDKSTGSMVIQEPGGKVDVDCGESSLQVFGSPRDEWDLESTLGKIEVVVPAKLGFELDAEASQGTLESEFPLVLEKPSQFKGAVNGGGPKIRIRTEQAPIVLWQR